MKKFGIRGAKLKIIIFPISAKQSILSNRMLMMQQDMSNQKPVNDQHLNEYLAERTPLHGITKRTLESDKISLGSSIFLALNV